MSWCISCEPDTSCHQNSLSRGGPCCSGFDGRKRPLYESGHKRYGLFFMCNGDKTNKTAILRASFELQSGRKEYGMEGCCRRSHHVTPVCGFNNPENSVLHMTPLGLYYCSLEWGQWPFFLFKLLGISEGSYEQCQLSSGAPQDWNCSHLRSWKLFPCPPNLFSEWINQWGCDYSSLGFSFASKYTDDTDCDLPIPCIYWSHRIRERKKM